ncbi:MAG: LUD domain-containing protein [Flavobacteriaceae bacterium]|nr:LUD domain-containing protein [Flavobacteriaceae bacterium]
MNILTKLFGISNKSKDKNQKDKELSPFMPEQKLPLDERFMTRFKDNGGKFLYCENLNEVIRNLSDILEENAWKKDNIQCFNPELQKKFKDFKFETTDSHEADFLFTTCEYLVADDGSVMFCSRQINERKLNELSENIVVFATTSQITNNIGESLRGIKINYGKKIPTNINTIKHFQRKHEDDFLSYGSSTKNLYLLLLEDL